MLRVRKRSSRSYPYNGFSARSPKTTTSTFDVTDVPPRVIASSLTQTSEL
jgi:hypothetical protein